jgi:4-aminobutyrate aminotransferase-like enzyme
MPIVSRADCTEIDLVQGTMFEYSAGEIIVSPEEEYDVEFFACEGIDGNDNDLESYYERLVEEENAEPEELAILQETIVGEDGCNGYLRELMDNLN